MHQYNLFGGATVIEDISFDEEYAQYISSAAWHRLRDAKIASVDGKCERCGISKYSARLEVHHKHYRTFKKEGLEDLEVLCSTCHNLADDERINENERNAPERALAKGFEGWMDRGNNPGWRRWDNRKLEPSWRKFVTIIEQRSGRKYQNVKFRRNPNWR